MKNLYTKRRFFYSAYLFLLILAIFMIIAWPHRFQKWNSIKAEPGLANIPRQIKSENALNVSLFIRSIPYQTKPKFVYSVLPLKKYCNTIIQGDGDCSNLSFGAAYYLLNRKIDFEIIHFLPPESFLKGHGHVALRLPYSLNQTRRSGVVDLAESGIPQSNGTPLDISDLRNNSISISILRLRSEEEHFSRYYTERYLDRVFIGQTPSNEVQKYFEFIEAVYMNLGNEELEKYLFDGLALLFGFYYHIYVPPEFFQAKRFQRYLFTFALWLVRATIIILPAIICYEFRRQKNNKPIQYPPYPDSHA